MKPRLVELLRCPGCGVRLTCHSFEAREDPKGLALGGEAFGREITTGLLACQGCDLAFPIIDEVPRVIRNAFEEYSAWFQEQAAPISAIERLPSHEATNGEPALVIRIFLSVLNVHINRAPCAGRVTSITHRPGKYLDARSAESAKVNESNMLVLETASGAPIGIRQISGAIARRIVCPVSVGHDLARGERYGMIKFGSTTELIVRDIEGTAPLVKPGDTVRGGVTILTRIP